MAEVKTTGAAVVSKRFIILEELGKGGHGKVYRVRDEQLDRVVAIKVFHDPHPEGERLMKEARTLCRLKHPGIINVYDVSQISVSEGEQTTITLSEDGGAQDERLVWAMIMRAWTKQPGCGKRRLGGCSRYSRGMRPPSGPRRIAPTASAS